jgi:hypothetical protein
MILWQVRAVILWRGGGKSFGGKAQCTKKTKNMCFVVGMSMFLLRYFGFCFSWHSCFPVFFSLIVPLLFARCCQHCKGISDLNGICSLLVLEYLAGICKTLGYDSCSCFRIL